MGFRVQGVQSLGLGMSNLQLMAEFRVRGIRFRVQGFGPKPFGIINFQK